ncbi:MAG TPA: PilZ domain-containing protein [Terriglobales bacterium]|nr:PilZ domain-containing protein [Terriglobales bacterium]
MRLAEERKTARYQLHLPLRIIRSGASWVSQDALTRNISSSGVLFTSNADVPVGGDIEYVVKLNVACGNHVELRCFGKVVRLEKSLSEPGNPGYLIAATLDRYQFVRHEPRTFASAGPPV